MPGMTKTSSKPKDDFAFSPATAASMRIRSKETSVAVVETCTEDSAVGAAMLLDARETRDLEDFIVGCVPGPPNSIPRFLPRCGERCADMPIDTSLGARMCADMRLETREGQYTPLSWGVFAVPLCAHSVHDR